MIDNRVYKRVKIHWWVIIILMGFVVWMIFAYIHQWGNNPVDKAGLVIFSIMFVGSSILIFTERYILTIDDKFVFFKFGSSSGWTIKIHVTQVEDARVEEWNFRTYTKCAKEMYYRRGTLYVFNFTRQALKIETKSGKIYRIAIRNAEKVKEEIEKRMSNNIINNMLITD